MRLDVLLVWTQPCNANLMCRFGDSCGGTRANPMKINQKQILNSHQRSLGHEEKHKRKKNLVGCPTSKVTNVVLRGFLIQKGKQFVLYWS
jgi:hypothetical protein